MRKIAFAVVMLAFVSLSACGGGGSTTPATDADKENAQQLFDEISAMVTEFQHWAESGTVNQYFSSCAWGAGNTSASCTCTDSGSFSASGSMDDYSMTFNNCNGITGTISASQVDQTGTYQTSGMSNSNCQDLSFEVQEVQQQGCSGTIEGTCNGSLSGVFTTGENECLITWN